MELPRRDRGDELLRPGAMLLMRERMRSHARRHDLAAVVVCAFDHRSRVLPFVFTDLRMAPAGVRAIGSALADAGFEKTRIVLQQWNRNFSPLEMRIDGRVPDLLLISSMHLHGSECDRLIKEACEIPLADRPLIVVGGPRFIYEPWLGFGRTAAADIVVTGEEPVLLSLLDAVLSERAPGESLRSAFYRARDGQCFDDIPGLVYGTASCNGGPAEELVDTGIQRLLGDLDELPSPVLGYRLLEPPSSKRTLSTRPLPPEQVNRYTPISSLVMTFGCKFRCKYCPIPAYNQSQHRTKSGARLAEEISQIRQSYRIRYFFGTDDNFLNRSERTLDIVEELIRGGVDASIGTEATVHDVLRMREHLPAIRRAGFAYFWLGVEDMTATLVKKGQSEDKTLEAFAALREAGIYPMPMMMHDDSQPLISFGSNRGLVNQVRQLRKAGAISLQVLSLVPAYGSQWFEGTFTSGTAFTKVGRRTIEPYMTDGNYVIASKHKHPWTRQLNILLIYSYFYNPLRFLTTLIVSKSISPRVVARAKCGAGPTAELPKARLGRRLEKHFGDAAMQLVGMAGLALTYFRTAGWGIRLVFGRIERASRPPSNAIPIRGVDHGAAPHALPATPEPGERLLDIAPV